MLRSIIWQGNTICLVEMENEPLSNLICLTYFAVSFVYYFAVVYNMLVSQYEYQLAYNAICLSMSVKQIFDAPLVGAL